MSHKLHGWHRNFKLQITASGVTVVGADAFPLPLGGGWVGLRCALSLLPQIALRTQIFIFRLAKLDELCLYKTMCE